MNKRWKKILLFVGLPLFVIGGFLYWLTWTGDTVHLESVASQFKTDATWDLVDRHVVPPKTFCVAQSCPELIWTWTTPGLVSQEELIDHISQSNWRGFKQSSNCEPAGKLTCSMIGNLEGYTVVLSSENNNPVLKKPTITLHIE